MAAEENYANKTRYFVVIEEYNIIRCDYHCNNEIKYLEFQTITRKKTPTTGYILVQYFTTIA